MDAQEIIEGMIKVAREMAIRPIDGYYTVHMPEEAARRLFAPERAEMVAAGQPNRHRRRLEARQARRGIFAPLAQARVPAR